ncbi:MAG: GNAT family N-acetyltransferase [Halioglobus sp.]
MRATIRYANPGDAASLAALAERTFRETFTGTTSARNMNLHCVQNFSDQIQLEEIISPRFITILAEAESELIAYAQLRLNSSVEVVNARQPSELYRLYVLHEQHGSGLANQVMQEALGAAAKAKSDYIWLGVWEQNPRAITFYKKYGFSVVGDHIFTLGLDPQRDFIMAAEIEGASVTNDFEAATDE